MARPRAFKIGDHVGWNSEAGRVSGIIRRKISAPIQFKGYTVHASREEPQYLIESDKTDHLACTRGRPSGGYGAPQGRERSRGARAHGAARTPGEPYAGTPRDKGTERGRGGKVYSRTPG